MRSCMYNAAEKLEDAVAILTSRFYNNLTYNSKDSDSIAAYYAADAVGCAALHACAARLASPCTDAAPPPAPSPAQHLSYCGEQLKGRYTIAKHLHGLMRQVSALGDIVLVVNRVDHQPLEGTVRNLMQPVSMLPLHRRGAGEVQDFYGIAECGAAALDACAGQHGADTDPGVGRA